MNKVNLNEYKEYAFDNYSKYSGIVNVISNIRLITFIIMIIMFIMGYYNSNIYNYIGWLSLVAFIILVIVHSKYYRLYSYYDTYVRVIGEYIDRTNDNWYKFSDDGADFINNKNTYLEDLDVLGGNSLFKYLSICKTYGGRKKLYDRFNTINNDSDSILELSNNMDFCIDYQISLIEFEGKNINFSDNYKYLDKSVGNRSIDLVIGIVISFITILFLILGMVGIVSLNYFYGMFIFSFISCYLYQLIYREEFEMITRCISNYSKLRETFNCILKYNFNDSKLNRMQDDIRCCSESVVKLNRIEILNNFKDNLISNFIFNGLFCINILTMYLYSKIQLDNNLKKGVSVVEELESMVSLSILGVVKNNVCMGKVSEDTLIEFNDLYHPLFVESKCVSNSFKSKCGINIITGSNMGGKSTFLRTIGINLVLMNAGGFVNAGSFKSSNFNIFTSMRVRDDLVNGISTFYGELLRIKDAIDFSSSNKNMIVLVDEIFKGTNYNDRIYGAVEVIKKLNKKNVILFVTTHDFELCEADVSNLSNYYFKEYYEKDKIKFDYIIRKGKCKSTNARYLMESLGIVEKKT